MTSPTDVLEKRHVALAFSSLHGGGIQRMMLTLAADCSTAAFASIC